MRSILRAYSPVLIVLVSFQLAILSIIGGGCSRESDVIVASAPRSITAGSSIDDILDYAEGSGSRWHTIYAEGHTESLNPTSTIEATSTPFRSWIAKPDKYRSEEGNVLYVKNNDKRYIVMLKQKTAKHFTEIPMSPDRKVKYAVKMARYRVEDPTLPRAEDIVIDTPLNDLFNPGYITRKELRLTARSVEKAGVVTIAGRETIKLRIFFPAAIAKEEFWEVFVDMKTGLFLGIVVYPLPGDSGSKRFIDKLEIDPILDSGVFDYTPPLDYVVENTNLY